MSSLSFHKAPGSPSPLFDVCVIGHVTRDIIQIGRASRKTPGGTAYYSSIALRRLGLKVVVLTRVAPGDRTFLLDELEREGITVICRESEVSSTFENRYTEENPDRRVQRITAVASPFSPEDLEGISATAYHVGPLTNQDVPVDLLRQVSRGAGVVSLDVQGMLRPALPGAVCEVDWPEKHAALACVDILKADAKEARVLCGKGDARVAATVLASMGPKEVIVSMGSRGAVVYAEEALFTVPPYKPAKRGDPTGCGDTYAAGYLYQRVKGASPEQAGRFAGAMVSLKLEGSGPFRRTEADVYGRLSAA